MDEKPTKKRSRWPIVVMAVVLLPPAYVLSAGPVWRYVGFDGPYVGTFYDAYLPVFWLAHKAKREPLLDWYLNLWSDNGYTVTVPSD